VNTLDTLKDELKVEGREALPIRRPKIKREFLAGLYDRLGFKVGVEVGVYRGYFSEVLCKWIPGLKLYSVDIWKHEEHYIEAVRTLKKYDCLPIRLPSVKAAELFEDESIDFVYIDGDHAYEPVMADLKAWIPKVRKGGIVSGHDYKVSDISKAARRCKVVQAVDEYTKANKIDPWFVIGESFVSWPSWLWVKGMNNGGD
jgi:predicted O-methyltransferase YrrM